MSSSTKNGAKPVISLLSRKATPGPWEAARSHQVQGTPVTMYWLRSPTDDYQGVSMGTGNDNDAEFIAALVNAYRDGELVERKYA